MDVSSNLKKLREYKGYTQEYMANELNMSQSNYSKLEKGRSKISIDLLSAAAKILEVDPLDILSFDEKFTFNIKTQKDNSSNGLVINNFPQEIRLLYEEQIKTLEEEVKFLRTLLSDRL